MTQAQAIEPFPLKREFIDPNNSWNSLATNQIAEVKVIELANQWSSIPPDFAWNFLSSTLAVIVPDDAYDKGDNLLDYFSESERLSTKKGTTISPIDFYVQKYPEIVAKANDLARQDSNKRNTRYYLSEAVFFLTKQVKPFKITAATSIYKYFQSKIVLDPNIEWGGRLLGAALARVPVYHGISWSVQKFVPDMINFVKAHMPVKSYYVHNGTFESANIEEASYDTVFTSIPMYEENEENKKRYKDVNDWLIKFAYNFINECVKALVPGGYLLLYFQEQKYSVYLDPINRYNTQFVHLKYLGVIGITRPNFEFASPLLVWKK